MTTAFRTVTDAKVSWVKIAEKPNKQGEMKPILIRNGVRVNMADGSWWFYKFSSGTWSRHYPGFQVVGKGFNAKSVPVEKSDAGLAPNALKHTWGHIPALLAALEEGYEMALTAEAEKRLAA